MSSATSFQKKARPSVKPQHGFTIIELLVAVAVGAIASILIMTAFVYTYGSVIVEQTRTQMVQQSQLFLRRMTEDLRVASEIRTSNLITDANKVGGWTTSDPANILITTEPATDSSDNLIFDSTTGYPYAHEVVYFGSGGTMYRRLLTNSTATGHDQLTTCTNGTSGCSPDISLVNNLDNMTFVFYDANNAVTTTPENARSIQITVNLRKKVYGKFITTTNTTRVTMRNEN